MYQQVDTASGSRQLQRMQPPSTDRDMVEVRFSCTNLADKDFLSLSDPFLVCHILHNDKRFEYVGETETVIDDVNPRWMTSFVFKRSLLESPDAQFVLHVFDEDGTDKSKLSKHDFLGMVSFKLSGVEMRNGLEFSAKVGPSNRKFFELKRACKDRNRGVVSHDGVFRISVDSKLNGSARGSASGKTLQQQVRKKRRMQTMDKIPFYQPSTNANSGKYALTQTALRNAPQVQASTSTSTTTTTSTDSMAQNEEKHGNAKDAHEDNFMKDDAAESNDRNVFAKMRRVSNLGALSFLRCSLPSHYQHHQNAPQCHSSTVEYDLERATSSYRARRNLTGRMTISVEPVRMGTGRRIYFKVQSNLVIDKSSMFSRPCLQFFEVFRQSPIESNDAQSQCLNSSVWNCIYRSEDGRGVDAQNFTHFSVVCLTERQLHNGVKDRIVRLRFMSRHTKTQHAIISYIDVPVKELLAVTKTKRYKMESEFHDDDDENSIGFVHVKRTDTKKLKREIEIDEEHEEERGENGEEETSFIIKADHFISKRFISVLDSERRHFSKRVRKIPKFISRH